MIASAPFSSARKTPLTQILTFFALFAILFSLQARADSVIATVGTGAQPEAFAFNPATNKLYVANAGGDSVTVIDGATNAFIDTITVGNNPRGIAVNSVTNKVYVTNYDGNTVTVINGNNDKVVSILDVGINPLFVAVNEGTSKVYVANQGSYNVTVINGNDITTIPLGMRVGKIAVNPASNKIYALGLDSAYMAIINGENNSAIPLWLSDIPVAIAVNPSNNKVYVAYDRNITVLDGTSNDMSFIGGLCCGITDIAVSPATNKIYVSRQDSVAVLSGYYDPLTSLLTNIPTGVMAVAVAVNSATNQIYVASWHSNNVTVIDGGTNTTSTVAVGSNPAGIVVDPVTSRIYIRNLGSNTVSIMDGERPVRISSSQTPLPDDYGWNNTDVTVTFAATDMNSTPICTIAPVTLTTDGISQVASATCTDAAGNSATINHTVNIDKTPPVLALSAMPKNVRTGKGGGTTIQFSLSDSLSTVNNTAHMAEARILNSAGMLVKTIQGSAAATDTIGVVSISIVWDGRDSDGAIVPGGTYAFEAQGIDHAGNKSNVVSGTVVVK